MLQPHAVLLRRGNIDKCSVSGTDLVSRKSLLLSRDELAFFALWVITKIRQVGFFGIEFCSNSASLYR